MYIVLWEESPYILFAEEALAWLTFFVLFFDDFLDLPTFFILEENPRDNFFFILLLIFNLRSWAALFCFLNKVEALDFLALLFIFPMKEIIYIDIFISPQVSYIREILLKALLILWLWI